MEKMSVMKMVTGRNLHRGVHARNIATITIRACGTTITFDLSAYEKYAVKNVHV